MDTEVLGKGKEYNQNVWYEFLKNIYVKIELGRLWLLLFSLFFPSLYQLLLSLLSDSPGHVQSAGHVESTSLL